MTFFFSALTVLFIFSLSGYFLWQGIPAIYREGPSFFLSANWYYRVLSFRSASMIYGSLVVAGTAIIVALPLSWGASIFISEYLLGHQRLVAKTLVELLAGIPSVVFGLLGVLFLQSRLFQLFSRWNPESTDNLLTAGILLGIMILPTIISLSDDAFRSVPQENRLTAHALGLTKMETFFHAVLPQAIPGLLTAILLGLGRALGETIAVFLVIGRADNRLPHSWFSPELLLSAGQTLTSKLGGSEIHIAYGNPLHWQALMALGLILFMAVLFLVLAGEFLLMFGRKYQ